MEESNIPTPPWFNQNWKFPFQSVGHSISRCMWHVLSAYVRENPGLQQLNVNSTPINIKYIKKSKCCFKYIYIHDKTTWSVGNIFSSKCCAHIFQRDKEAFFSQLRHIDHKHQTVCFFLERRKFHGQNISWRHQVCMTDQWNDFSFLWLK